MAGRVPGDWADLVVVGADTTWDARSAALHRYALGLRAWAPVLVVDPPRPWRGGSTRRARPEPRSPGGRSRHRSEDPCVDGELQVLGPRLARLTPVLPPGAGDAPAAVGARLAHRSLRRALAALGSPAVGAVVSFSAEAPPPPLDARRRAVVVPDAASLAGRAASGDVDVVVVCSPVPAGAVDDRRLVVLPPGCDVAPAGSRPGGGAPDVALDGPVAGFVGRLTGDLDVGLLAGVADRGCSVLLVGPCHHPGAVPGLTDLLARPNVRWVGPRARGALDPYLRAIDVGLVPIAGPAPGAGGSVTEVLDHLAIGRPVVTTGLDAARWILTGSVAGRRPDPVLDLVVAPTADGFVDAVTRLAGARPTDAAVSRRRAVARAHAWDRRVAALAAAIGVSGDVAPSGDQVLAGDQAPAGGPAPPPATPPRPAPPRAAPDGDAPAPQEAVA